MIYLITGANGSGKTLNALKWVRELQVKDGRSVYFNGFDMKPEKAAEFGWQKFDPLEWQKLPDGAIMVFDECQDQFPPRANGSKVPDYVNAMAVHRKRGFDFFLITQHPRQLDTFVKSLIGSPGWHRHIKRPFGADMASVLEWSAVHPQPEKDSSGKNGKVTMTPHPKEVYGWYNSAVLHTGKKHVPRQVYVLAAAAVLVPAMIYGSVHFLTNRTSALDKLAGPADAAVSASAPSKPADPAGDLLTQYSELIPGFPHTAPRYAEVVQPVVAPYPAACIQARDSCLCYTQQGTRLPTPADVCAQVVRDGFFIDWEQRTFEPQRASNERAAPQPFPNSVAPVTAGPAAPYVRPPALTLTESRVSQPSGAHDGSVIAAMRAR